MVPACLLEGTWRATQSGSGRPFLAGEISTSVRDLFRIATSLSDAIGRFRGNEASALRHDICVSASMMSTSSWTIVLAAGAGRRLASVTGGVPKQYWRPEGAQSLLESTVERLGPLALPERTLTIVDATHRDHVRALGRTGDLGAILYQPMDRGTAAGVLLPLAAVFSADPEAVVVITPSDHGVAHPEYFRSGLARAIARVESGASNVVLFGTQPASVSMDFGWIKAGPPVALVGDTRFERVYRFVEKPPLYDAFMLFSSGAVWNTMVLVARAASLVELYRRCLPFHVDVMLTATGLTSAERERFLYEWYPELPPADFCRDVLAPSRNLCLYTFPLEMGWSDLGTPERMAEWMERHRLPAARPEQHDPADSMTAATR
jgi:mannose-1-phosphate guanylyltransferase